MTVSGKCAPHTPYHPTLSSLDCLRSTDLRSKSVYHTNVMMALGTGVAIVCAESVKDAGERRRLLSALRKTHEVRVLQEGEWGGTKVR